MVLAACSAAPGGGTGGGSGGGTQDGGDRQCTGNPADLLDWVPLNTVPAANGKPAVTAYRVTYRSGGLKVHGQICVPESPGPHPIFGFNHGGVWGLGVGEWGANANPANQCYAFASNGAVAVMSQYRGESDVGTGPAGAVNLKSEGSVELCLGEVDDAVALMELARKRCDVNPDQVVMTGPSHGGCVTLQVSARQPSWLRAVIPLVAPVDWADQYRFSKAIAADAGSNPGPGCGVKEHQDLVDAFNVAAGGPPETHPDAYRQRSPRWNAAKLGKVPLYMVHGLADCVVDYRNSGCAMRAYLRDAGVAVTSVHLNDAGTAVTTAIAGCGPDDWTTDIVAPDGGFAATHLAIVVDSMTHGTVGGAGVAIVVGAAVFAAQHGTR